MNAVDSLNSFFDMGGYAAFVWPAYALGLAGLIGVLLITRRSVIHRQAELDRLRPPASATISDKAETNPQSDASLDKGMQTRET